MEGLTTGSFTRKGPALLLTTTSIYDRSEMSELNTETCKERSEMGTSEGGGKSFAKDTDNYNQSQLLNQMEEVSKELKMLIEKMNKYMVECSLLNVELAIKLDPPHLRDCLKKAEETFKWCEETIHGSNEDQFIA